MSAPACRSCARQFRYVPRRPRRSTGRRWPRPRPAGGRAGVRVGWWLSSPAGPTSPTWSAWPNVRWSSLDSPSAPIVPSLGPNRPRSALQRPGPRASPTTSPPEATGPPPLALKRPDWYLFWRSVVLWAPSCVRSRGLLWILSVCVDAVSVMGQEMPPSAFSHASASSGRPPQMSNGWTGFMLWDQTERGTQTGADGHMRQPADWRD